MLIELPVGLTVTGNLYEKVETGPITGKVMKELSSIQGDQSSRYKGMRKALELVLEDIKGYPEQPSSAISNMYYVDGRYVLHEVAKHEYPEEDATIVRQCPSNNCGVENTFKYDLDEIPVITLEDQGEGEEKTYEYDEKSNEFVIPFTLEHGLNSQKNDQPPAKHGELSLITIKEFEKTLSGGTRAAVHGQKRQKQISGDLGRARFDQIFYTLHSLEQFNMRHDEHDSEKEDFGKTDLERMRGADIKKLEGLYQDNLPGVQYPTTEKCEYCGAEIPMGIDPVVDFFL